MKLLHAADLHVDSPMRGLVQYDDAPTERLRLATRGALTNLVDRAIEEQVDVVLFGGDIFDGNWAEYTTGVFFVREMGRLRAGGIEVVVVWGNHDAESKMTRSIRYPENVNILDTRKPETIEFESIGLAVHGQGYATPAVLDDLSLAYPVPVSGMTNVGLLHTCAGGRNGHEPYAPCSVDRLASHGYEFWGLGHVHRYEVLSTDPLIVFPGNLQGRGWRETGAKGAVLVEINEFGGTTFEPIHVDVVRWETLTVDVSDCLTRNDVGAQVADAVRGATAQIDDRLLAARVVLEGVCDAHTSLVRDGEGLRAEVIAAVADVAAEQVWVGSVKLDTRPPSALVAGGDDAVGELVQELEELRTGQATADVAAALAPLEKVLPVSVLDEFDPLDADTIARLLDEVSQSLPVALLDVKV